MAGTRKNVIGQKFGLLTVLRDVTPPQSVAASRMRNRYVLVECDCKQRTSVRVDHLRRGKTRSCGCLNRDARFARGFTQALGGDTAPDIAAAQQRSEALAVAAVAVAAVSPLADPSPRRSPAEARHDLEAGDYERMLTEQGGVCCICQEPPGVKPLHVDHCHTTGKVRGLLCNGCNTGLGFFREDIMRMARAMKYLSDSLQ